MVSTSEVSVSLTVDSNESIPALAANIEKLGDVEYEGRKAIVCMVGKNIRETPGIAAKVFGAIADTDVRMISRCVGNQSHLRRGRRRCATSSAPTP